MSVKSRVRIWACMSFFGFSCFLVYIQPVLSYTLNVHLPVCCSSIDGLDFQQPEHPTTLSRLGFLIEILPPFTKARKHLLKMTDYYPPNHDSASYVNWQKFQHGTAKALPNEREMPSVGVPMEPHRTMTTQLGNAFQFNCLTTVLPFAHLDQLDNLSVAHCSVGWPPNNAALHFSAVYGIRRQTVCIRKLTIIITAVVYSRSELSLNRPTALMHPGKVTSRGRKRVSE